MNELEALKLDEEDELRVFRNEFLIPRHGDGQECVYLAGNSLGLQPKSVSKYIDSQLHKWASQAVEGHFTEPTPWLTIDDTVQSSMASLVGALPSEVVLMNSLTSNLHLMMVAFYRPTPEKFKILIEKKAFPSDVHAVVSQIRFHGVSPEEALLELSARENETFLRTEDIEKYVQEHGASIALVLFSGVQYFTGQAFDIKRITAAGQAVGCRVGFDLAHAVGNIPLSLHESNCDFACWCTYKYLNCGPGSIGGCFVHEKNFLGSNPDIKSFAGWWGHRISDRFDMMPAFCPSDDAYGYRLSNPPVLLIACVRASLDLFDKAGMDLLRKKSLKLTGYLERLLLNELPDDVYIMTTPSPAERGCQLSLRFVHVDQVEKVNSLLKEKGIICDVRKPNIMRVAPAPLYNSFSDVFKFVTTLKEILGLDLCRRPSS